MTRSRWTEQQRATALAHYVDRGAAHAAAETGIPLATIYSWANRAHLTGQRTAVAASRAETARRSWRERRSRLGDELAADIDLARAAYREALKKG